MIRKEITYFLTALMFFTRIPCPKWLEYSDRNMQKSRKYFPFIGWIVGGVSVLMYWGACYLFSPAISIILSMIASVLTTGAFHEDGFTDVCDGFGGGWGKEKILTIMKDSRIGAYGGIGIILLLGLKFAVLYELNQNNQWLMIFTLFNAHITSRFIASTMVQTHKYVQDIDQSKSKPLASQKLSWSEMIYSSLFMLVPLAIFQNVWILLVLPTTYLSKMYLGYYFKKHIGGYTGDCLGATQQVSEIVFYLTVLGLWKFIS